MGNNGLRFYQIFKFGGTIGVNEFTFGELIAVNGFSMIIILILVGLLAAFFPFLMLLFYVIFLLMGNWEQNLIDRARTNLLAIIGYVYFMFDYHYGFIGWSFVYELFGKDAVDKLCHINTTLFVINLILLFYGTRLFGNMQYGLLRVAVFIGMLYFGNKMITPISERVIPKIVTQHVAPPEVDEGALQEEKEKNFRYNEDYYNDFYGIE
jgi:hypothetical protein